ncbi:carbonic anhydrase 2-like [Paramacrobiotus metropolitanus]|uniref:carbonic anhydrase 2-like n=1 Tax=Paramacrobiotus metropolitanus TaxID=2943436 RepID=UPI002445C441|nr:carbonic anhydrase 2-like [Paramacrobiotus metropolitanus]
MSRQLRRTQRPSFIVCILGNLIAAVTSAVITLVDPNSPADSSKSPVQTHWGYTDSANHTADLLPETWAKAYPGCDGRRQSPIPINTRLAVRDPALEPVAFVRYGTPSRNDSWTAVNLGHVAQFTGHYATAPEIRGGSLGDDYVFLQFHFHWGSVNTRGSEHVIDGQRYPLELHIVHRKSIFYDNEAPGDSTGFAALAIMFELADSPVDENDPRFVRISTLFTALLELTHPGQAKDVTLKDFRLQDFIPTSPVYYRYLGSLTTPPCAEAVMWTVFKEPLKVTQDQLNMFRTLKKHPHGDAANNVLVDNFRPVQQSHGREVKIYPGQIVTTTTQATPASPRWLLPNPCLSLKRVARRHKRQPNWAWTRPQDCLNSEEDDDRR